MSDTLERDDQNFACPNNSYETRNDTQFPTQAPLRSRFISPRNASTSEEIETEHCEDIALSDTALDVQIQNFAPLTTGAHNVQRLLDYTNSYLESFTNPNRVNSTPQDIRNWMHGVEQGNGVIYDGNVSDIEDNEWEDVEDEYWQNEITAFDRTRARSFNDEEQRFEDRNAVMFEMDDATVSQGINYEHDGESSTSAETVRNTPTPSDAYGHLFEQIRLAQVRQNEALRNQPASPPERQTQDSYSITEKEEVEQESEHKDEKLSTVPPVVLTIRVLIYETCKTRTYEQHFPPDATLQSTLFNMGESPDHVRVTKLEQDGDTLVRGQCIYPHSSMMHSTFKQLGWKNGTKVLIEPNYVRNVRLENKYQREMEKIMEADMARQPRVSIRNMKDVRDLFF